MKLESKKYRLLILLVVCYYSLASLVSFPVVAHDNSISEERVPKPYDVGSLPSPNFVSDLTYPQVLSSSDVTRYLQIFKFQKVGRWQEAHRLINRLNNNILLGHVLAQRYLHPTKYRSKYRELKGWLAEYSDLPQAGQIYKLAIRRKPKNWTLPKRPTKVLRAVSRPRPHGIALKTPKIRRSLTSRKKAQIIKNQIRSALRKGHTLRAKKILNSSNAKKYLNIIEYDQHSAKLGQAYFSAGRDEWALKWAENSAFRSGKHVPQAHWTSGLTHWRLGNKKAAADHFAQATKLSSDNVWFHAAAAFWAARAYLVSRQPEKVNVYLQLAAKNRQTFYGILSRRMLGQDLDLKWEMPAIEESAFIKLTEMPRGRRAMALLQIGDNSLAERELRNLGRGASEGVGKGILALAARGRMASLAIRLDHELYPQGGGFDGATYPIPAFTPSDGFRIDRALIYALIRQESKFNPSAKSWAGARGLMQLMPRTARFVAKVGKLRLKNRSDLYKPEINLALGQKYIEILLKDKNINGSLFLMVAAWNGGPGNLNKWRKATEYMDDPLFFIESIPARETRNFIEHVLSNLWIYRDQLGQRSPSLDAVATGSWPQYTSQGQNHQEIAHSYVTLN